MIAIVGSRNASACRDQVCLSAWAMTLGQPVSSLLPALREASMPLPIVRASRPVRSPALAGGQDCIYPPENVPLADAIMADGALVTEMPMGWSPRARDFPRRNRLISGMVGRGCRD